MNNKSFGIEQLDFFFDIDDATLQLFTAPPSPRNAILSLRPTYEEFARETGQILVDALMTIMDGETSLERMEACEKTPIGTKFEKRWLRHMNLPVVTAEIKKARKEMGLRALDSAINGTSFDIKFSLTGDWMIPPHGINNWMMLVKPDFKKKIYSLGFLYIHDEFLNRGMNWDRKRTLNSFGRSRIDWIIVDHPLEMEDVY